MAVVSEDPHTTLLVKNLPVGITSNTLKTVFSAYGKVLTAFIVDGKQAKGDSCDTERRPSKFAFVKVAQCDTSKVLSEQVFAEGVRLKVSVAQRDRRTSKLEKCRSSETTTVQESEHDLKATKQNSNRHAKTLANKAAEIFIRGVPFECTAEELETHFCEHFGAPKRVYLVKDPLTQLPKGTAFIEFIDQASVDRVMIYQDTNNIGDTVDINIDAIQKRIVGKSLASSVVGDTDKLTLDGRTLLCSRVLCPEEANMLKQKQGEKEDRRNTKLLDESIPKEEGALRTRRLREVAALKTRFATDGNLVVSTTRLSIRRIPKVIDEKRLKTFFTKIAFNAAKQAEKYLTGTLLREARQNRVSIKQIKIVRASVVGKGEGSNDKAKTKENKILGKSRGFGFIEFREPAHSLLVMRYLMQHPNRVTVWKTLDMKIRTDEDEPILEFAVDKANVLARMRERLLNDKMSSNK